MHTIPGISRQDAVSDVMAMMPTPIHMIATSSRKAGLEGRRPTSTGRSTSKRGFRPTGPGAPFLGVVRPWLEDLLRRSGMDTKRTVGRGLRTGQKGAHAG